ncbi:unnamed protein product [Triticum turgidum subsp. durum]|uniref:SBP-type domain-containing protein n=1 Tax=Triticum turgidum subsp. durum TaxID=4567 RepID=A0A9R1BLU5_TRITD|nr:unnamed protein product [Triticum turgidum subsp. durum]
MSSGLKNKKKKGHEWDLNDWRWDGNLFLAMPSPNADAPSGCGSRELGRAEEGGSFGAAAADKRRRRRRVTTVDNPEECSNTAIPHERIAVRGGQIGEEEGPASAAAGASSSSAPSCQVDGCHADLGDDRDYHRRHKVCEPHTKSTLVRIRNIEHRFCQQCSRFHLVQEFDEGKKSCRSRLATHNRRRRKAPAEAVNSLGENQSLTNTLLLLLRQLAGQDSAASSSEQINGPNLLVSLLKNLAAVAGTQACQDMLKDATSSNAGNYVGNQSRPPVHAEEPPVKRRAQNFDLNDAYVEEDEILNWLSHYPSDMESYIRPGCVILTIYLRLPNLMWDKLNVDPAPWIENLISISTRGFWEKGWLYARVQDHLTLSCNGRLMLVSPWQPVIGDKHQILLLCIFDGKYLVQEATQKLHDNTRIQQGPQCLTFSCSFPITSGRGFIEVEDYDQSSISFPFVVAEESICCEIRMLEEKLNIIAFGEGRKDLMASRSQALKFLHEIGWLLQRSHTRATSSKAPQQFRHRVVGFPAARFRWLLSFAVDQEWCGVVKMLLDTLFQGNIDIASPVEFVLGESLVFTAVNKRSKPLVASLLRYTTKSAPVGSGAVATPARFLFTPDMTGPSDITPLHVAATISNAAAVLDALTDDPQQLGIKTWKNARDASGYTPEDYARRRGHTSYIQMVQNKINSRLPAAHVSVSMTTTGIAEKHADAGRHKSPVLIFGQRAIGPCGRVAIF